MKSQQALVGSILLLALALAINGVALLLRLAAGPSAGPTILPMAAAQNPASTTLPGIYYLARDTYFLTASSDGRQVFLWYYDFEPREEENKIRLIRVATAQP